jgi:undecaprenyl-diphosphatase
VTNKIEKIDNYLLYRIFRLNGRKSIDAIVRLISRSGDGHLYLLAGLTPLLTRNANSVKALFAGMIAFAVGLPVQKILKNRIRRMRPFEKLNDISYLIAPPDRYSFPSGHTSQAFLVAHILNEVFPGATLPLFTWAGCVGFSRVYLGVHYPTDVAAGMVLGLLSSVVGLYFIF